MADLSELFYKQWEKMFTLFMEQLVQNKTFLGQMGKLMETSNFFKMTVDRSIQKALESMQIPTRKDIDEAVASVHKVEVSTARIEQSLARINEKLDAVAGALAALASLAGRAGSMTGEVLEGEPSEQGAPKGRDLAGKKKAPAKRRAPKKEG
jgi:hypothetical protein